MISVAIDGPSGAGKSSIARTVSEKYGFVYVDTGAIYRTIGLAAYLRGIDTKSKAEVLPMLEDLRIDLSYSPDGEQRMFLDGRDVSAEIRLPHISLCTSDVSAMQEVRDFLTDMQRDIAKKHDVIMDGRDIGTVILPNAEVKIFLTASAEARAERRLMQLLQKGTQASFEEVVADMKKRDEQDTRREASPLVAAEDAVILDTSDMTLDESIAAVCKIISDKTGLIPER